MSTSSLRPEDWDRLTDQAFKGDLEDLGWKGNYKYDDPEVVALRVSRVGQRTSYPRHCSS